MRCHLRDGEGRGYESKTKKEMANEAATRAAKLWHLQETLRAALEVDEVERQERLDRQDWLGPPQPRRSRTDDFSDTA